METFYRTHKYLVEHVNSLVKRGLMDEIDWSQRLIGIKGSRGVGKTTFLLQYAKERYGTDRACLYINLNNLYFTNRTLFDFAQEFHQKGGKVLLVDQVFKYLNWSEELKACYDLLPDLQIVFTGSSVMRLKEENPLLSGLVESYNLRGFSFREYLNLVAETNISAITLEYLLQHHVELASQICAEVKPLAYWNDYLHHGFYPFFLEKRNFSENLVKTINMTMEIDILFVKQIELSYLPKIRKLLYLLALNSPSAPNVSQLSKEIQTSRATVVNYIKSLKDARLINMLYPIDEEFPKKPAMVYLHNTNLIYGLRTMQPENQVVCETFFYNALGKDNKVNKGEEKAQFLINQTQSFNIVTDTTRMKISPNVTYAIDGIEIGEENQIPLWMFGLLY